MHFWTKLTRRAKIVTAVVVVVVLAAGGIIYSQTGGKSSSSANEVVILNQVQRRTLQSTVALTGTLGRKSLRNITAGAQGLVSAVWATNDSTAQPGEALFSLDGRDAIAEQGTVPFFRPLTVGDAGADVQQLKQILAAAGDNPGPINNQFTEQTQFALAQWQAAHDYPNATPATDESATVSLAQGTGYTLGDQVSAGLIIGPPAPQTSTLPSAATSGIALTAFRHLLAGGTPTLTIQSVADDVVQGSAATFIIEASAAPTSALTVNLTPGGTAGPNDVVTPPTTAVLAAGSTEVSVQVQTRATSTVETAPTISMALAAGTGYDVGSPSSAQTTIKNDNVPTLQISGSTSVAPGNPFTVTVTADQAPLQNTQVELEFAGSAQEGTDYDAPNPVLTLPAGSTTASVTVDTRAPSAIEPNRFVVVTIAPSPGSYAVGAQSTAVITLNGSTAEPTVTLTSAQDYLQKGQPYQVAVGLSEAVSTPLTINLSYGGNASPGTDYTVPAGNIVIPAGQTSTEVTVPTVTNNNVEADTTLVVSLAPGTGYVIGSPNSASVTIHSTVVPELTISGTTTSVAQGGAASFVITANQPVVKATSVNYSVEGTAQPGQNYQPVAGTALLEPGQSQVTVVLQSLLTDVEFEPTDMIVGQWPTRIGEVFVKAGDPATPGEAILSLTESDLTVTFDASATDRTSLAVGQSCTVQISGDTATRPGTITELDSTPTELTSSTPGGSSSQVYEGRIEVTGLQGADGSAVSINVVDQQVNNAITVPIAAVKQNGVGTDVVRVYNRKTGQVTEVPVTTGLTEGSYIQVDKGLHVGETVIVEVDQSQ